MNSYVDYEVVVVSVSRSGCSCFFCESVGGEPFSGWSGLLGATTQLHCKR